MKVFLGVAVAVFLLVGFLMGMHAAKEFRLLCERGGGTVVSGKCFEQGKGK